MKLKNLLVIQTVVALGYGLSFVLLPRIVMSVYGIAQGPGAVLLGRYFGLELIAVGLLAGLARNVTDVEARGAILIAYLFSDIVGVIVSVQGVLSGAMSAVGWTASAIYLFFALAYAYFLFIKTDTF